MYYQCVMLPSLLLPYLPELLVASGEAPEGKKGEVCRQLQTREIPHQIPVHDGPGGMCVCVWGGQYNMNMRDQSFPQISHTHKHKPSLTCP